MFSNGFRSECWLGRYSTWTYFDLHHTIVAVSSRIVLHLALIFSIFLWPVSFFLVKKGIPTESFLHSVFSSAYSALHILAKSFHFGFMRSKHHLPAHQGFTTHTVRDYLFWEHGTIRSCFSVGVLDTYEVLQLAGSWESSMWPWA